MKLGLVLPHAEPGISPEIIRNLAQRAERLGYHSLWAVESSIFPSQQSSTTVIDRSARDVVRDPLTALAFAASGTDRIRVGLSIVNVPFHSPVALATSLSALDRLSNGRVQVGVGVGYSESECQVVTSTLQSRTPTSEFVEAFETLWRGSDAGYQGTYFFIPKGATIPEPVQAPHPPISMVAFAPAAVLPSATLVNGRISAEPATLQRGQVTGLLNEITACASPCPYRESLAVRARLIITAEPLGPGRAMFHGSPSQVQADVALARSHGVTELMFDPGDIEGDADLTWALSTMRMVAEMVDVAAPQALVASA